MIMKKLIFGAVLSCSLIFALFCGCAEEDDLFSYVSENRTRYYIASSEESGISLKAFYTLREYPYAADGVKRDMTGVFEVEIRAEKYYQSVEVGFSLGGENFGGEANYNAVKEAYEYSVSAEGAEEDNISFSISADGNEYSLEAENKNAGYLSDRDVLLSVKGEKAEYINSLTDGGKFCGEIYIRFIFDGKGYYYVGIISAERGTLSLLADASTGKIVAEKEG